MPNTKTTRKFITRIRSRACENFGAVDYTITETLTEYESGVKVVTTAKGIAEGERVNDSSSAFYAGMVLEKAAAYRLTHGYVEVLS